MASGCNHKIDHDIDEVADVDGGNGLCGNFPTEVQEVERDHPFGKIKSAGKLADRRRDDVFDKRGGDAFEGAADDDTDGEVDDIATHDEGLEFLRIML